MGPRVGAGLAALAACVAAWALWPSSEPAAVAQRAGLDACAFAPGDRLAYELRLATELHEAAVPVEGRQASIRGLPGVASLTATLELEVLEVAGQAAMLAGRVTDATPVMRRELPPTLPAGLDQPFGLVLGTDCAVHELGFQGTVSAGARSALRGIVAQAEVRLPKPDETGPWVRAQPSAQATYLVQYEWIGERELKRDHVQILNPTPEQATRVLSSATRATLGARGAWLDALLARDSELVHRNRGVETGVSVVLELGAVEPGATPLGLEPHRLAWLEPGADDPLLAGGSDPETERLLAGLDPAGLWRLLDRARGDGAQAHHDPVRQLWVRALRAEPGLAAASVEALRSGELDEHLELLLTLALQKANTPEAHDALVDMLTDGELDPEDRVRAAAALGQMERADAATVEVLQEIAESRVPGEPEHVGNDAALAIGALGGRWGTRDDLYAATQPILVDRLAQPYDNRELYLTYKVIGNTGDPRYLPDLRPHLKSTDGRQQTKAAAALRRMHPATTQPLVTDLLWETPVSSARRELVASMTTSYQMYGGTPAADLVEVAVALLEKESIPQTRAALIELLGLAVDAVPAARAGLIAHFKRESSTTLLSLIGRYVPAEELL